LINEFINATLKASSEVYHYIHKVADEYAFQAQVEGAGGDISIGFDVEAENIYIKYLALFGEIHSEECGIYKKLENCEYKIVIDPIDGSDNIKSKFPYYGSSIALQKNDVTIVGIVCNFATAEVFVKSKNEHYKTYLYDLTNKLPIVENNYSSVGIFEKSLNNASIVKKLRDLNLKFRTPGAIAVSLAEAYYVNYVLFFGTIRSYDVEAGLYLCSDLHVEVNDRYFLVSKNKSIFDKIIECI